MGITRPIRPGDGCAHEQRDPKPQVAAKLTGDECGEDRGALGGCAMSDGPDDCHCGEEAQGVDNDQRCHAAEGAPRVAAEIFRGPYARRAPVGLGRYDGDQRRGRALTPVLRGACTRSPRSRGGQGHRNQVITGRRHNTCKTQDEIAAPGSASDWSSVKPRYSQASRRCRSIRPPVFARPISYVRSR